MADGILTISGFSDFRRLLTEYRKLEQANVKLKNDLAGVSKQSRKTDSAQEKMLRSMSRSATAMIGTYASLQTAIRLVNTEIEKQQELGRRATTSGMSIADSEILLRGALGPKVTNQIAGGLVDRVKKLGRTTGFGESDMLREFAESFSASEGPVTPARISRVEGLVKTAEPLFRAPSLRGEMSDFVGAALDLKKGLPSMSDREALGVMLSLRSQARITETGQLKNLIPAAVAGQVARPDAPVVANTLQSLALTAALGSRIGDPTGETTGTAGAAFLSVMAEVAPQFNQLPPIEALMQIQKDPVLKTKFKEQVLGRMRTKPVQKEMIEGMASFLTAENILPELLVSPDQMNQFLSDIETGSPELSAAATLRKAGAKNAAKVREEFRETGNARTLLFGGQVGDEEIVGKLDAMTKSGRFGDGASQLAAKRLFNMALMGGSSPEEAAAYAMSGFFASDSFISAIVGRESRLGEDSKKANETIESVLQQIKDSSAENVQATRDVSGAANAAAQIKVHSE